MAEKEDIYNEIYIYIYFTTTLEISGKAISYKKWEL